MFTIKQLCTQFNVSRSTLLYYDKIDVLRPSIRSDANYRLYTKDDVARMKTIMMYRDAGLSLEAIKDILSSHESNTTQVLEQRLLQLNADMSELRRQQQRILHLLGGDSLLRSAKVMNKAQWVGILKASGMDEAAMRRWHIEFERDLPEMHTDFLASLGCSDSEIAQIKAWSRCPS